MDKFTRKYNLYKYWEEIKKTTRENIYVISVQLILTFFIFPYILYSFKKTDVLNGFLSVDANTLFFSSIMLVVQIFSVSLRFFLISRSVGEAITFSNILTLTWFSAFIGHTPLGSFGADITKVYQLKFYCNKFSNSITIVALDRLFGTIVIGIFMAISVIYYYSFFNQNLNNYYVILIALLAVFLIVVISFVTTRFKFFPIRQGLLNYEVKIKKYISFKMRAIDFYMILITSIIAHVSGFLALVAIIASLAHNVSIYNALMLSPIPIFISHLPISVGGWGVRELTAVTVYHMLGINEKISFISSVIYGLLSLVISLPGIIFLSASLKKRI